MLLVGIIGVATCKTELNDQTKSEPTQETAPYISEVVENVSKDQNDSVTTDPTENLPKPNNEIVSDEHIINNNPVDIENPDSRSMDQTNSTQIEEKQETTKPNEETNEKLNLTISNEEENQTYLQKAKSLLMKSKNVLLGLFFCSLTGIFAGSTMVPLRFNPDKSATSLISFGIGAITCNLLILFPYFLIKREFPNFHFKYTVLPGFANGICWSIGMILATYITMSDLGLTIGYPLCQCAMIVSSLWGILVFKEIRGWKSLLQFSISILILVPGCILLGIFGKQ